MSEGSLFKFDVIKLAKQFLKEVEIFRGYKIDLSSPNTKNQESRVNTFFRLIGLPSIVKIKALTDDIGVIGGEETDAKVLTPGFKLGYGVEAAIITNSEKKELKVELDKKQKVLSDALYDREKELEKIEKAEGSPKSNKNRKLAFKKPMTPKMNFFGNYQGREIFKSLSPFIVSYFDVFPRTHDLSRPFLQDPRKGYIVNTELKRPFLETVILIRLVNLSGASSKITNEYTKSMWERLKEQVKSAYSDDKEMKFMASLLPEKGSIIESFIIEQLITVVPQLAKRWVSINKHIDEILKHIDVAFVPLTPGAKQNPIGKQSNQSSFEAKNSQDDKRISQLEARIRQSEAIISLLPIQDSVARNSEGNSISARNVMSNALTSPFISILTKDLDEEKKKLEELKTKRKELSQKADKLRLEIDMMTGEFSGLSVPDVVFTIMSLFLLEKKDLLNMLDLDVLEEMKLDAKLKSAIEKEKIDTPTPEQTLESVEKLKSKVEDLYTLFEMEIKAIKNKTKRTSSKNKNKDGKQSQSKSKKVERTVSV